MAVEIINPKNNQLLKKVGNKLCDPTGKDFPIVSEIPRIGDMENYSKSFGFQWKKFNKTQLDDSKNDQLSSFKRFFAQTSWNAADLKDQDILEVGSGAGRFSKVILENTTANLYSIDYSDSVLVNKKNNGHIAPERFHLFQASIYEMPFPDNSFDKVFCFGVLQHTPNFEKSVQSLIAKTKPGGEVVVDFYPIKGWWTKVHAKYFFRPFTIKMPQEKLLTLIDKNINWLIGIYQFFYKIRMGFLTRFLPICDIHNTIPENLDKTKFRELVMLDTFDMFSPMHDHPQRIKDVVKMFISNNMQVTFSGILDYGSGLSATVRGFKKKN